MSFTKAAALGAAVLALSACGKQTIEGNVSVKQPVSILAKQGTVTVPKGNFYGQIVPNMKSAQVKLFVNGAEYMKFDVSGLNKLKNVKNQNRAYIRGSDIGQNFDIDYSVIESRKKGSLVSKTESCSLGETVSYREVCEDTRRECSGSYGRGWSNIELASLGQVELAGRPGGRPDGGGDRPERPERPERPDRPDFPRPERPERPDFPRPERPERPDRPDFPRPEIPEPRPHRPSPELPDRPNRPNNPEYPERPWDCGSSSIYQRCYQEPTTSTVYGSRSVSGYETVVTRAKVVKFVKGSSVLVQLEDRRDSSTMFESTKAGSCR